MAGTVNYEAYKPLEEKFASIGRGIRQQEALGGKVSGENKRDLYAAKLGEAYRDQRANRGIALEREKFTEAKRQYDASAARQQSQFDADMAYRREALASGQAISNRQFESQEDSDFWGSITEVGTTIIGGLFDK